MKIIASGPITLWQIDGKNVEMVSDLIFLVSKINAGGDCSHEIKKKTNKQQQQQQQKNKKKPLAPWKNGYDKPREYIKKQRHYFADKGPSSQSYGFSNGRVWM